MAVHLVSKFGIAVTVSAVYLYTAELYPTKHRHALFAFSSMMGRIAAVIAPLSSALSQEVWEPLPSLLFGSLTLLSGLLVFTLPETLGTKLPDSIEEAENLSKTSSNRIGLRRA